MDNTSMDIDGEYADAIANGVMTCINDEQCSFRHNTYRCGDCKELYIAIRNHARPQIEAEARAAAVADVAEAIKKGVHASIYHAVLTIASAPAGFVCVPENIKTEMIAAGLEEARKHIKIHPDFGGVTPYMIIEICKAMLAARPK